MSNIVKKKDERTRNWVFVAYPESIPENWKEILTEFAPVWARSPLHDKDVNPDGTPKKPHWHFVLKFDGNKSFEQIKEITNKLNAPNPQKCNNIVGQIRYLIHRDNPEKAQYSESDILEGGGFEVAEYLKMSPAQERQIFAEMLRYCRANGIDELCDLGDFILDEKEIWLPVFVTYNAALYRCLRSRKCKNDNLRAQGN